MDIIEKAQNTHSISREVIKVVMADEELQAGLRKAYKTHQAQIKNLQFPTQFKICLDTVGFGLGMLQDYQKDQKEFKERLDRGEFDEPKRRK